jgi:8-oxo-dGTP pyrophosphatase MutT (NUDIX family)
MSRFVLPRLREKLSSYRPVEPPLDDAQAAVAAILRPGPEGAEILLIKRAEREGDPWSGHLAFPGGKRERTDASLWVTAVRETQEEVGLTLPLTSLVTRLDDVRARTNGFKVAQFVFALEDPEIVLTANVEVNDTLWVSLERVARDQGKETMTWNVAGQSIELPCVHLGHYVLWGMTHRMVMQVIDAAGEPLPTG